MTTSNTLIPAFASALLLGIVTAQNARIYQVTIKVTNEAPKLGTCQTPAWVGLHNGIFDTYDRLTEASPALERIAEDGNAQPLVDDFAVAHGGFVDGVVGMEPICPGASATIDLTVILPPEPSNIYFSYASMVLPSNDAFIANGNPRQHLMFDGSGNFVFQDFVVFGTNVLDAGTERNDERPQNTAFFGQRRPDNGRDEDGVVRLHRGFKPKGDGGILDSPKFANADFTAKNYQMVSFVARARKVASVTATSLRPSPVMPISTDNPTIVITDARGSVKMRFLSNGEIYYKVKARNIESNVISVKVVIMPTDFDLDVPAEAVEADAAYYPVALLAAGVLVESDKRLLVKGSIKEGDAFFGMANSELWSYVSDGKASVVVATKSFPGGEVSGFLI